MFSAATRSDSGDWRPVEELQWRLQAAQAPMWGQPPWAVCRVKLDSLSVEPTKHSLAILTILRYRATDVLQWSDELTISAKRSN